MEMYLILSNHILCSTHTVWEFVSTGIGAQSTVLAGGRYDSLFTEFGAKIPVPVCMHDFICFYVHAYAYVCIFVCRYVVCMEL